MLDTHAARTGTPGVAVGVYLDGEEFYAYHGVTSVENPLPVDANTLFQFGSTGKTFTATAMMRLAEAGKVDLDATVRRYLPEFASPTKRHRRRSPCCSCSTTPRAGPATSWAPARISATTRSPSSSRP